MKKLTNAESRQVNGGYYHCTVCCVAGDSKLYNTKIAFTAHTLTSKHKKNVKVWGYGHECCLWYNK